MTKLNFLVLVQINILKKHEITQIVHNAKFVMHKYMMKNCSFAIVIHNIF